MHEPYTQLHLHLVWATWDRQPIILPEWKAAIGACIQSECRNLKVTVIAQYAMSEHVHLLVRFPTTVTVAIIAQQVKGSSSHLITHETAPGEWFKWQGGYGAFAVSARELPRVQEYIRNQEQHHRHQTFDQELEQLD
ncbi:MAG: IS200/IS605 family transposase [Janthinobacterium lividum]